MTVNGYLSINAVSDQEENLTPSTLLRNVLSCVLGNMEYCKSVLNVFFTVHGIVAEIMNINVDSWQYVVTFQNYFDNILTGNATHTT